jgi:arylsulfatase
MKNRSWTLTAEVTTDGADTEGVVMAFGGVAAGVVLYLDEGVPVFDYNYFEDHFVLRADRPLAEGDATITVGFEYEGGETPGGPATIKLGVNGEEVASGKMDATVKVRFGLDTFGIGMDTGQPVTFEYEPPFAFTGKIEKVVIEMGK